jgi:hypothetical protein
MTLICSGLLYKHFEVAGYSHFQTRFSGISANLLTTKMVSLPINQETGKTSIGNVIFKGRKKGLEFGIGAKMTRLGSSCFNTKRIPHEHTFFTFLDKVSCNKMLAGARYMPVFMVKMNGSADFMEIHINFIEHTSVCIEKYLFSLVDL